MNASISEDDAIRIIRRTIDNCEKILPKFADGSAQATLLINRIQALKVALAIIDGTGNAISANEVNVSLPLIQSIIHKTTVARQKYTPDTSMYKRLTPMIETMKFAQAALLNQLK